MNNRREWLQNQFDQMQNEEANQLCFDCDKHTPQWASINNGIFLCLDCSGDHRSFGINISFIKSISMDKWTESQLSMMITGGNQRLRSFLLSHDLYRTTNHITRKNFYSSKIMAYYRSWLKAESNQEPFNDGLPRKDQMLDSSYDSKPLKSTPREYTHIPDYAQLNTDDKLIPLNQDDNNNNHTEDNNYINIDNNPFNTSNENYPYDQSSYFSIIGNVYQKTKNVLVTIKNSIIDSEIERKVFSIGGKAWEIIAYASGKVVQKGYDLYNSEILQTVSAKAGQGISYITSKVTTIISYRHNSHNEYDEIGEGNNSFNSSLIDKSNVFDI